MNRKFAFTLTEVLLATVIVGVLAGLVLPTVISRAQDKGFDQAYERNKATIAQAVEALPIVENTDFFKTEMFTLTKPAKFDDTSGKFMKKYLKVARVCPSAAECFADQYYKYNDNKKEVYTPTYDGACAKLKNGASLCLLPQIGGAGISGIIDLNGIKGPNVLDRDLRDFSLDSVTRTGKDTTTTAVKITTAPDLELGKEKTSEESTESSNPCVSNPNTYNCCLLGITESNKDYCCKNFSADFNDNPMCTRVAKVHFKCNCSSGSTCGVKFWVEGYDKENYSLVIAEPNVSKCSSSSSGNGLNCEYPAKFNNPIYTLQGPGDKNTTYTITNMREQVCNNATYGGRACFASRAVVKYKDNPNKYTFYLQVGNSGMCNGNERTADLFAG